MNRILILRDANLLIKAKKVFGDDLVTDAFVCCTLLEIDGDSDSEINIKLKAELHESTKLSKQGLEYYRQLIRLTFCNGRSVYFESSEWSSMCSAPNRDPYIEWTPDDRIDALKNGDDEGCRQYDIDHASRGRAYENWRTGGRFEDPELNNRFSAK